MAKVVDIGLVAMLRMVHEAPGCSQNSCCKNESQRLKMKELVFRGFAKTNAYERLTLTDKGEELLDIMNTLVGMFDLDEMVQEECNTIKAFAKHRNEYNKKWAKDNKKTNFERYWYEKEKEEEE